MIRAILALVAAYVLILWAMAATAAERSYPAEVVSVYDGDTITVSVDLGLGVVMPDVDVRFAGIDTPELRGEERPEGIEVRDWLRERLPAGTPVSIVTDDDSRGKYGRLLADVLVDGGSLIDRMLRLGLGRPYTP